MSRYSILFIAYLLALSLCRPFPGTIPNKVDVSSISKGHPATYYFTVTSMVSIASNSNFLIDFPAEFSAFSSPLNCHISLSGGPYVSSPCTIRNSSPNTKVVTLPSGPVPIGVHKLALSEVFNPLDFPSTSNINVTIALEGGSVQQIVDIEGIPLLPSPIPILDLSIWMAQRFRPDRIRDMTFKVHSQRYRPGNNHVHMRLPSGLGISSDTVTVTNYQGATQIYTGVRTPDSRSIYIYNVSQPFSPNFPLNFTISAGLTFVDDWAQMAGCTFDIILSDYPRTLETATNLDFVIVNPLALVPSVSPSVVNNGSVNTFKVIWDSPMAIDSFFDIFIEMSRDTQLVKPCQAIQGVAQDAACTIQGTTYKLSNIGSIANSDRVAINIFVKAPERRINLTISIEIKITIKFRRTNENVATGSTSVDVLIRSSSILRSITYNPANVANLGETALLHFFFRFVDPMPGTNARTDGKIVLEIRPQLPKPDLYLRKILKCMFSKLRDASECYWDNSDASKSVITMKTPPDFNSNEVDIEINTFDPIANHFHGIPLFPVNETYYYKVYTFHNNETIPSDIYQDEFQPRSATLALMNADLSNLNAGDDAGLRVVIGIPTQNMIIGHDYFIRIVFDNSLAGFADYLGFPGSNLNIKYPCRALRVADDQQPTCMLYTSNAGNANNEIHVYGNFTFGVTFTILIPKIRLNSFAANRKPKVTVSVAENMPGILDNYPNPVDLHKKSVSLGVLLPASTVTISSGNLLFNMNATTPQISAVQASVRINSIQTSQFEHLFLKLNSLNLGSSGEDGVAVEFDVVYFPVFNLIWIIKKANNPSLTFIAFNIPTRLWKNGPWLGPFPISLNYYLTNANTQIQAAAVSFDSLFDISVVSAEANQKMYTNYHHYINVTGPLKVGLHTGSSIAVDVTGFNISPDSVPYCKINVVGGPIVEAADITGIRCIRESPTRITISNYRKLNISITITITIKIQLRVASGTATLTTYYNSDGTNVIERSRPLPFNFNLLSGILLQNFLMLSEFGPEEVVSLDDLFIFNLIPAGVNITTVKVTFPENTTIPNGDHSCYINGNPVFCTVNTDGQLTVIFASQIVLQGLTEFQFSPNGQSYNGTANEYGLEPGYYDIVFELFDQTANLRETQHQMIFLRPPEVKSFSAVALIKNINFEETLWKFSFKIGTPIRDWGSDELPHRIYLEFPTGPEGFNPSIGVGIQTFGQLPCCIVINGIPSYSVWCDVYASNSAGVPALLSIANFSQISSNDNIELWVTGIHHPPTMTSYPPVGIIVTKIKDPSSLHETLVLSKTGRARLALRDIATITTPVSRTIIPINLNSTGPYNPFNTLDALVTVPSYGFDSETFIVYKAPANVELTRNTVITCPNGVCYLLSDLKTLVLDINNNVAAGANFNISFAGFAATPKLYWKYLEMKVIISNNRVVENIFVESYDKAKLAPLVGSHSIDVKGVEHNLFGFTLTQSQSKQLMCGSWIHHGLPINGSIFITFSVPINLYHGCISLNHLDFDKSSLASIYGTPYVGCDVIGGNSIKITPRDFASGLATGRRMHITFAMDTPAVTSYTATVASFLSENPDFNTENPIEQGSMLVNQRTTKGLTATSAITVMEAANILPGQISAFEFNFVVNQDFVAGSSLTVTFPSSGLKDISSPFNLRRNRNWQVLVTDTETGTIIPSRLSVSALSFNITITITITFGKKCSIVIDTQNEGSEDSSGLVWPAVPDIYILQILAKNAAQVVVLKKEYPIRVSPLGQGSFKLSNKASQSSQLVIEAKFNLTTLQGETANKVVFKFDGKVNPAVANNALLNKLNVEASSRSAIVDGGCILWPGRPKGNQLSVSCPVTNNIAQVTEEMMIMFSLPNDIFITDVDQVIASEIIILSPNGTILYFQNFADRIFIQPTPAALAYENMTHFGLSSLTIQSSTNLVFDVPCPRGLSKGDTMTVLAGFGYSNSVGIDILTCSPNCEVAKIDKNIVVRATGPISFGTRVNVTGIRNPNYVRPIDTSVLVCAYDANPFLFQSFKKTPAPAEAFFTVLPPNEYALSSAIIPNFRKNMNAVSLSVQGNFRNSGTFVFQFRGTLPVYKMECYSGMGSEVNILDCFFDVTTNYLIVNTEKYNDNVSRLMRIIGIISIIGNNNRRIFTIGPQLLVFNQYLPPIIVPYNTIQYIQYINTFDNAAIEVETIDQQRFKETLVIDKYNHFGINKKPTNKDPDCCYWYRFQVYVAGVTLPARMDLNATLLSEQIKVRLPSVTYLNPKNDLCFVNNQVVACTIVETAVGVNILLPDVRANMVQNDMFDFQIGFYIGPTGVIDGFYMLDQDLLRVALKVFPFGLTTLHSNYLSDILVIKPKLLSKFQIQDVVSRVTSQRNAITFRVNSQGFLTENDKPRLIIEFEVGRNGSHLFNENLGSFSNGAVVPCVAISNMEVIGQLHCYFVAGNSFGKFGINGRIYVEGFKVLEPLRDYLFRIAGFMNPSTACFPTFAVSLFKLNNFGNYELFAYNELYGALKIEDSQNLVLRTNPVGNLIDIVGSFFNRRTQYRITVNFDLDASSWILLEIQGDTGFCQFVEDSSMIGYVDGATRRFLQVKARQHRRGDRYSFTSFVCAKPGDIIRAYIYQSDQLSGETIFMQFPNDIDLLALRNRVPVVNDNDVRASMNLNLRPSQTYGVVTISMMFSGDFLRDQAGFLLPQYGMLASLSIDPTIFDEIQNICYVQNGFSSSQPTTVVLCTVNAQGQVVVRGWDSVILFNNTNPDQIQIVFIAKLKAASYYANLRTQVTLQFYADTGAYNGSFPYFNLYVPLRPITYTSNRILSSEESYQEESNGLLPKDSSRLLAANDVFRCQDLANNVTYTIVGRTNLQVVEIRVQIQGLVRSIGLNNMMAIFMKNWQYSIFPQTWSQIRTYPCLCNIQTTCYYYPPKSLNNDSPFTQASLIIDFLQPVNQGSSVSCYFPALLQNLNQAEMDAVILTDNFIAYDEAGEIRNLGGCNQLLANNFIQGNQLNFSIAINANVINYLTVTLTATVSQFFTTDYVIVDFGSRFLFNTLDTNALCAPFDNCRIYQTGTLIIVGNPKVNGATIVFNGIRYLGWVDDGSPDTVNSTVFTGTGDFRGSSSTRLPNMSIPPLPAVLNIERPAAYIYENILFTLQFRTGDYVINSLFGGYYQVNNLTFLQFQNPIGCAASSDMGGFWNFWICQVIGSSVRVTNYWRRDVPANTTFTIQFRGKLLSPPLSVLGLQVTLIQLPGNNGYQRLLNTQLNVTSRINTTVVLPIEETQAKNINLFPVIHENYPASSGPLKIRFKAGADLATTVKISSFNVNGKFPLCWVNEFNLDNGERLLPDYPKDSFYSFCHFEDNNSSVLIDFPFKANTDYEIVFTATNGSKLNNLFNLNQIDNVDWSSAFQDGRVNFTLYNASDRLNSYLVKCQHERDPDFAVSRIEVSSKVFNEPKTILINIKANKYIPAYPRGIIDINLPDSSYNGMFSGWGANIYNPIPEIGVSIPCDVIKNNLDFGKDRGTERTVCTFHRTSGSPIFPVTITVKVMSAISRGESVNILIYGLLGPNSRNGVASADISLVEYPWESNSFEHKRPIDHLFQMQPAVRILTETAKVFTVPAPKRFLQAVGVNAVFTTDVSTIPTQTLPSPISAKYVEFKLPEFLLKVPHNIENGTITLNGQVPSELNRDHSNGIIFMIFNPPIIITGPLTFGFSNLIHDIFPCRFCSPGVFRVSDGSNARYSTDLDYPYQSLAMPVSTGFVPGAGVISNFNNIHQLLAVNLSIANAHPRTEIVKIRIPNSVLSFVQCRVIFDISIVIEFHRCVVYAEGADSVIQLNIGNAVVNGKYKIQIYLPGAVPTTLAFNVEEYLSGIMFQTGINSVAVTNSVSIIGTNAIGLARHDTAKNSVGNIRRMHKPIPRFDTNRFWFTADYPANFGNSYSSMKVTFLESSAPAVVFSSSQFICAFLDSDSDADGVSEVVFPVSCVYDLVSNSFTIGAPQVSTIVPNPLSWKKTIFYIECFLSGVSCFSGLRENTPIRLTTNGKDVVMYYKEAELNFNKIKMTTYSDNPSDLDYFIFDINQFGEYGIYKGAYYDQLYVEVAFNKQVFSPLSGLTQSGEVLKSGFPYSTDVNANCEGKSKALYPGQNRGDDHVIVYPENMLSRTRNFNIKLPFIRRPLINIQIVITIRINGFFKGQILPNVVSKKHFFFQQSLTPSSPAILPLRVTKSNFVVDNPNLYFNISFTSPGVLDENSLIIYGLTYSTDSIEPQPLCGAIMANVTKDTFVFGSTVYYFAKPKNVFLPNDFLDWLNSLKTASSKGSAFFTMQTFANSSLVYRGLAGPIESEILINNQTLARFTIEYGNPFKDSEGIYKTTFVLPHILEAKGSIFIQFPPEFALISTLEHYENCDIRKGMSASLENGKLVECSKTSPDTYVIRGYNEVPANTRIEIQFALKAVAVGVNLKPVFRSFSQYGLPHSEINNMQGVTITNQVAPYFLRKTFGVRLDSLYPGTRHNLRMSFNLNQAINFNANDQRSMIIDLDTDFVIPPNTNIWGYYRKATDNVWSIVSRGNLVNNQITFNIRNITALLAATDYDFLITFELGDDIGIIMPETGRYDIGLQLLINNGLIYISFIELLVLPRPFGADVCIYNPLVKELNKPSVLELTLKFRSDILPSDEIWIQLTDQIPDPAITSLARLYPWDYEHEIELAFQDRTVGYKPRSVLHLESANDKGSYRIKINITITIGTTISLYIPNVYNPNRIMFARARVSLMRVCRSDNRLLCEILFGDLQYRVIADYSTLSTPSPLVVPNSIVSLKPSQHLFAFNLSEDMNKFDFLLIKYPNPLSIWDDDGCTSSMGQCIKFPKSQMAIVRLASPISGNSAATLSVNLTNANYETVAPLINPIVIEAIGMVWSRVINEFTYPMPTLRPIRHSDFFLQVLNSRNFNGFIPKLLKGQWNTVQFRIDSFFDIWTELITIDYPSEVNNIDVSLCNATITVPTSPNNYPEPLNCVYVGNQLRLIPSVNLNRDYVNSGPNSITFYSKIKIQSNTQSTAALFTFKGYNLAGTGLRKHGNASLVIENVNVPRENSMGLMRVPATNSLGYSLQLAINAISSEAVSVIEYELPIEFTSNITAQSPVDCRFTGQVITIFSCFVVPGTASRPIKFVINVGNYFGSLGVMRIGGPYIEWIKLPPIPLFEYIGHVTLIKSTLVPIEEFNVVMNLIFDQGLDSPIFSTYMNAEINSPATLSFGSRLGGIAKGFATIASPEHTRIVIEFLQAEGYDWILGFNGISDPVIDCTGINIVPQNGQGLLCEIKRGELFKNPEIHIYNFQAIPPNTSGIQVTIWGITTPTVNSAGGVRVHTKSFVNDIVNPNFISSLPLFIRPQPFITANPPISENSTYGLLKQGRKWNITITITITFNFKVSDTLEVLLPENLFFRGLSGNTIGSNFGGQMSVFEKVGVISFTGRALAPGQYTFYIDGVPIPPFTVLEDVSITGRVVIDNVVKTLHIFKKAVNSPMGIDILSWSWGVSNQRGGFCGNQIDISFKLGYSLAADGFIRIVVPTEYLRYWNGTDGGCTPQFPFPPNRKCTVNQNQLIINTDGIAPPNQDWNIQLKNICLPNDQITSRIYLFAQYNASNSSIYSVVSIAAPPIVVTPVQQCTFVGSSQFPNAEEWSDYVFNVTCPSAIEARSIIRIRLPGDFADSFGPIGFANDRRCSVIGIQGKQDQCKVTGGNFIFVDFAVSTLAANTPFQLVIHDVINPGPNVYRIIMQLKSDDFLYGQSLAQTSINIIAKRIDKSSPLLARSLGAVPQTSSQISSTVIFTTRMGDFSSVSQVVFKFDQDNTFNYENRPIVCRVYLFTDFLTLNLDSYYWRELNNNTQTLPCVRRGRNIVVDVSNGVRSSTKHIAWVLDGIRNPSLNRVLPIHIYYLTSTGEVFWSGFLNYDTSSWLSVKPIRIELATTTNNKQGAFANMNFTMNPFGGFVGQSEVALHLSSSYNANLNNPATFCIDDNDSNIDCIQEELQYSIRNFDGVQNNVQFNYGMSNIINPSSATCVPGGNANSDQYHADVVNFRNRELVFKTFRLLPGTSNCLEYIRRNFTAIVTGPRLIYPGTSNTYTITLEAGSPNFRVRVNPSHLGISAQPVNNVFNSLFVVTTTFNLNLDLTVPQGNQNLIFTTVDPDNTFDDIVPFNLLIGDIRNAPNTTIFVESFDSIENNESPQYLFIYLRRLPPLNLIITIDSNGAQGVNFNPQSLSFGPNIKEGFVSVRVSATVLNSVTLRLFVTGPQGEYVPYVFSRPVINVPVINTNQGVRLEYTLVQKDNIGMNNATVTICFNKPAFANYILVGATTTPPSASNVLVAGNGNPLYVGSGKVRTIQNTQTNTNCTQLFLHGLSANTDYSLYVVGDDGSIPTDVRRVNFKTQQASNAIILHMFLNPGDDVNAIKIIMASILGVTPDRIIIVAINRRRLLESGEKGEARHDFIIAPERKEGDESPADLAEKMKSRAALSYLKQKVPSFNIAKGIQSSEFKAVVPEQGTNLTVTAESYNSATFTFNLTGEGQVFGVRVAKSVIETEYNNTLSLTGNDIYYGRLPGNVSFPSTAYLANAATSNSSNVTTLTFSEVEDGVAFEYHFVLADKVDLDPPVLSSSITVVEHTLKKNPYSVIVDL